MTPDTLTIVGTGIALAALNVGLFSWLKSSVNRIEGRLLAVEKQQAHTTGLLEGLGLTGRATPAQEAS